MSLAQKAFIRISQIVVHIAMRIFYRLEIRGLENIPRTGPVIIASNHLSYLDPPLLGAIMPRDFRFVAADDLFRVPPLAALLHAYQCIPINRGAPDRRAYHEIVTSLRKGQILILFVEGTRSSDGNLQPFESGASRAALLEGVPIVPTTITGTFEAWPRRKMLPRTCKKVIVKFHRPIAVHKLTDRAQIREMCVKLCDEIRVPMQRRLSAYHELRSKRSEARDQKSD